HHPLACHAPSANPTYRPNRQKSLFCPYSNFPSDGFLPRQNHALEDIWSWMGRKRVARVCGLHEFSYVSAYAIEHCNAVISGIMGDRKRQDLVGASAPETWAIQETPEANVARSSV